MKMKRIVIKMWILVSLLLFIESNTQAQEMYWQLVAPNGAGPSVRHSYGLAYHEAKGVTVLFGGAHTDQMQQDTTYIWDGSNWQNITSQFGPTPRQAVIAYDKKRERIVLFGGNTSKANTNFLNDTWELFFKEDEQRWVWEEILQHDPSRADRPSPRNFFGMTYDGNRQKIVLFGGLGENGQNDDLWEWDGNKWQSISAFASNSNDGVPGARWSIPISFNGEGILLYGGSSNSGTLGDTWFLNGRSWELKTPLSAIVDPGLRALHVMSYDSHQDRTFVFGGWSNGPTTLKKDTWYWNGQSWNQVTLNKTPAERSHIKMVYDSKRRKHVLFGGRDDEGNSYGDTWELTLVNHSPEIDLIPDQKIVIGDPYSLTIPAHDFDMQDTLNFALLDGPLGMVIQNGQIIWPNPQIGEWNVNIRVSDGQLSDSKNFTISVSVPGAVEVIRSFSPYGYKPGASVTTSLEVNIQNGITIDALTVEETVPEGLGEPYDINEGGNFIPNTRVIRWFIFGNVQKDLSYTINIPQTTKDVFLFNGSGQYIIGSQESAVSITGQTQLSESACIHPIDLDEDLNISTSELLSGASRWKEGQSSPTTPELLNGASIWKQGGNYQCDSNGNFVVQSIFEDSRGDRDGQFTTNQVQNDLAQAIRDLPDVWSLNTASNVSINLTLNASADVVTLEESVPAGWMVSNISDGGTFDANANRIRWFFLPPSDKIVTYSIQPVGTTIGSFNGTVSWSAGSSQSDAPISGELSTAILDWIEY